MANTMKQKKLKELVAIKEKRTFITRMYCVNPDCDGEYKYDSENQFGDIFGSLFQAANDKPYTYKHMCSKCGDIKEFVNMYPLTTEYEIGIDTSNEIIANFIANDVHQKMKSDLELLGVND